MRKVSVLLISAAAVFAVGTSASAKPAFVKKAKDLGFNYIQNCASCHVDKMPKAAAKGEPFGEIGKFLKAQKAKHNATEIDLNWLKEYKAK